MCGLDRRPSPDADRGYETGEGVPTLDAPITGYAEDGEESLFCLTQNSLWRLQTDSFQQVFSNNTIPVRERNECIARVARHRFWIGSSEGLITYDAQRNTARRIAALGDANIRSIYPCRGWPPSCWAPTDKGIIIIIRGVSSICPWTRTGS